eukprot:GHVU01163930.1.p1 GENE.GHVU01163930.1~~GHVU01163930.1.p1  ORF type:complete len:138 (+),score=1.62 GHVU01163930.1:2406-2819(+)
MLKQEPIRLIIYNKMAKRLTLDVIRQSHRKFLEAGNAFPSASTSRRYTVNWNFHAGIILQRMHQRFWVRKMDGVLPCPRIGLRNWGGQRLYDIVKIRGNVVVCVKRGALPRKRVLLFIISVLRRNQTCMRQALVDNN